MKLYYNPQALENPVLNNRAADGLWNNDTPVSFIFVICVLGGGGGFDMFCCGLVSAGP